MLERLFPRRAPSPKPLPQPNAQLALGALLVRVALANRQYLAAEVAQIDKILSATFSLKPLDAMWAVAMADGRRDEDEGVQLLAIETALGLSDADIAEARKNALGEL